MARELEDQIEELTKAIRTSNRQNALWYSFVHGIVSGIGSTVGVAVILGLSAFLLRNLLQLGFLAPLNRFIPKLEQTIEQKAQQKAEKLPSVVTASPSAETFPSSSQSTQSIQ